MSVSGEMQVDIVACLDDIYKAFRDGGAIIEKIKRKRALRGAPAPPHILEELFNQAPSEIEVEKQRGLTRYGKTFEDGDPTAVIALQQICIHLQQTLLEKLQFDDDEVVTDFTSLVDAADLGRDRTKRVLYDLKDHLKRAEQKGPENPQNPAPVNTFVPNTIPQQPDHSHSSTHRTCSDASGEEPGAPDHPHSTTHRTWSDVSGEEPATVGADDTHTTHSPRRKRFRDSIVSILTKNSGPPSSEVTEKTKVRDRSNSALQHPSADEPSTSRPISVPSRPRPHQCDVSSSAQPKPKPKTIYTEVEEDSFKAWDPDEGKDATSRNRLEHQNISVAPDQLPKNSLVSYSPLRQPSFPIPPPRTDSNVSGITIATPTPGNDFLGFCKGAFKLQIDDRKGSMYKAIEANPWSRHHPAPNNQYLACQTPRCAFRSSSTHPNVEMIWKKLFVNENKGIKVRWTFLAKSHVFQKDVEKHQYTFQCLFCTLSGNGKGKIYHGMEHYLEHIDHEHRGRMMNDEIIDKTHCIQGRVAGNEERFDINIWPRAAEDGGAVKDDGSGEWAGENIMGGGTTRKSDSLFSDEPWHQGLSDPHPHDRIELEY